MTEDASLDRLHPITNLMGTVGPFLFGCFGVLALLGRITSWVIDLPIFTDIAIVGLAMFILGMITIPIQIKLGYIDENSPD